MKLVNFLKYFARAGGPDHKVRFVCDGREVRLSIVTFDVGTGTWTVETRSEKNDLPE